MADPFEEQWEEQANEMLACELVEELVDQAYEAVKERERDAAIAPSLVEGIAKEMHDIIAWYFIDHDAGEPEMVAGTNPSWQIEPEPEPAPIDSWSRGAVPAKPREAPKPEMPAVRIGTGDLSARSVTSRGGDGLPPRSPRTRTPSIARPGTGQSVGQGATGELGATGNQAQNAIPICRAPEGSKPAVAAKKENALVTQDERRAKRLAKEAELEAERLERLRTELKDAAGGCYGAARVTSARRADVTSRPPVTSGRCADVTEAAR
jgi:hypothetical protein